MRGPDTVKQPVEAKPMSLDSELSQLISQHKMLEKELTDAIAHPATSDAEIAAIKRRKLKVKDEIMRLERETQVAA
jgi:hypothetical protein